jgi:hypothetical protein
MDHNHCLFYMGARGHGVGCIIRKKLSCIWKSNIQFTWFFCEKLPVWFCYVLVNNNFSTKILILVFPPYWHCLFWGLVIASAVVVLCFIDCRVPFELKPCQICPPAVLYCYVLCFCVFGLECCTTIRFSFPSFCLESLYITKEQKYYTLTSFLNLLDSSKWLLCGFFCQLVNMFSTFCIWLWSNFPFIVATVEGFCLTYSNNFPDVLLTQTR